MDLLAAMRIFVRVVERGSLSAAARDLGIGQPAVSERIQQLERHLGVRLLLRSTRAVSCTDEGHVFYERCKQVLEAADEACAVVSQDHQVLRGVLRIAAPQGLGEVVLPALLLRLREQHPQLRIDLILNDRLVDPITEGVDVSLRLGPTGDGSFIARRLGHVRRVLVAAPDYLARHGAPETPQALVAHTFIRVLGLFGDGQLPLIDAGQKPITTPINVTMSLSHWRPVYALLEGGGGVGVLQEPVCAEAMAAGRLIRVLPDYVVPGFDLHALIPAARPIPPKTRAFLAQLDAHLQSLPGFA
ncbi:LysR family transcriptional regulator [Ralstonia insidiosa]|uniref:LysR family transcriptional regulator n=1 Tax=Ralstonia insidiosa TaxID=190721 RepID=A0A192A5K1_9RALS|nr:LysR family transcriptional regulator [Ralstonia insidiosa]ANJ75765.1 LysR family transcriptional regulator [Ralstonia insidiosa]KAB0469435.1 LysR family transcriptional regulator [Ralstonia insidiosa]MBY4910119.1 LysR family transcriptional regulator [Ralstonia insidiosa]